MIGVGVIALDRPHYLGRLVASLEQQQGAGEFEYHLFQDGIRNPYSGRVTAIEHNWRATTQLWRRARLPRKGTHVELQNRGVGLHQFAATEWMAAHYDRVMMVEDDVVLSPHWLRLLGLLLDRYSGDEYVFGFSPGYKRLGTDPDKLRFHWEHWWCEGFAAEAWRRARPHYQAYLRIIRGVDYRQRDHEAIRALFAERGWVHPATSQDAAKDMAIACSGQRRVVCEVNRAISIGKTGIHFTPGLFARLGYENQTPYTFDADATRERFDELEHD